MIVNFESTTMERAKVAVCGRVKSVACMVKVKVPVCIGVPEIIAIFALDWLVLRPNPGGSCPETMLHVSMAEEPWPVTDNE